MTDSSIKNESYSKQVNNFTLVAEKSSLFSFCPFKNVVSHTTIIYLTSKSKTDVIQTKLPCSVIMYLAKKLYNAQEQEVISIT